MPQRYGFFNSVNGDREYFAEDFGRLLDGLIRPGVFANYGGEFMVTETNSTTVDIDSGKAWLRFKTRGGVWFDNDYEVIDLSSYLPSVGTKKYIQIRIAAASEDAIGVHTNFRRTVRFWIYEGSASANPSAPLPSSQTNSDKIAFLTIAFILLNHDGIETITNLVGQADCPYVTGPLETIDISQAFTEWQMQFDNWFSALQEQLSGDVATNLQAQIDQKLNKSDKATADEVIAGKNNTKYITPRAMNAIYSMVNGFEIGDIVETTRNDFDDSWLLCNGEGFNPNKYPELNDILGIPNFMTNTAGTGVDTVTIGSPLADGDSVDSYIQLNDETILGISRYTKDLTPSTSKQFYKVYLNNKGVVQKTEQIFTLQGLNAYFQFPNSIADYGYSEPSSYSTTIRCENAYIFKDPISDKLYYSFVLCKEYKNYDDEDLVVTNKVYNYLIFEENMLDHTITDPVTWSRVYFGGIALGGYSNIKYDPISTRYFITLTGGAADGTNTAVNNILNYRRLSTIIGDSPLFDSDNVYVNNLAALPVVNPNSSTAWKNIIPLDFEDKYQNVTHALWVLRDGLASASIYYCDNIENNYNHVFTYDLADNGFSGYKFVSENKPILIDGEMHIFLSSSNAGTGVLCRGVISFDSETIYNITTIRKSNGGTQLAYSNGSGLEYFNGPAEFICDTSENSYYKTWYDGNTNSKDFNLCDLKKYEWTEMTFASGTVRSSWFYSPILTPDGYLLYPYATAMGSNTTRRSLKRWKLNKLPAAISSALTRRFVKGK